MITTKSLQSAIKLLAQAMEEAADELNTVDGLLGDGDLGVTMIRGFRQILEDLESMPEDIGMDLFQCAKAFTKSSGSSFGTLLATGMMAIAKEKNGEIRIELDEVSRLLDTALKAMQMRGKASLGDKTVLDVIAAARDAAKNQTDGQAMLNSINQAIRDTMELFRNRQSQIGRARIFGEKSIGLDDPGMLAFKRMFESLKT
jgi:dihydroxyacetone kinase-like protein|tara:strand:+ start:875 stop:1477 length:603 start_codon:yes stop_codon:yes gene_type:complete